MRCEGTIFNDPVYLYRIGSHLGESYAEEQGKGLCMEVKGSRVFRIELGMEEIMQVKRGGMS